MAADVVEGPRDTVGPADHDDALTPDIAGEEVSRLDDLVFPAEVDPAAMVEFFELLPKDRLVRVEGTRRGLRGEMVSHLAADVFRVAPSHDSRQRSSQICAYRWFHLTGSSTAHRRPRTFFRRRTMRDAVASLRRHGHPDLDRRAFDPVVRRILRLARRTSNRATRRRPPLSRVPEGPLGHQGDAGCCAWQPRRRLRPLPGPWRLSQARLRKQKHRL